MKIRQVGAEVVSCRRSDEQKDMPKLIVAFRSFANEPKKYIHEDVKGWLSWVNVWYTKFRNVYHFVSYPKV